jgi:hypothetical protein
VYGDEAIISGLGDTYGGYQNAVQLEKQGLSIQSPLVDYIWMTAEFVFHLLAQLLLL